MPTRFVSLCNAQFIQRAYAASWLACAVHMDPSMLTASLAVLAYCSVMRISASLELSRKSTSSGASVAASGLIRPCKFARHGPRPGLLPESIRVRMWQGHQPCIHTVLQMQVMQQQDIVGVLMRSPSAAGIQ